MVSCSGCLRGTGSNLHESPGCESYHHVGGAEETYEDEQPGAYVPHKRIVTSIGRTSKG